MFCKGHSSGRKSQKFSFLTFTLYFIACYCVLLGSNAILLLFNQGAIHHNIIYVDKGWVEEEWTQTVHRPMNPLIPRNGLKIHSVKISPCLEFAVWFCKLIIVTAQCSLIFQIWPFHSILYIVVQLQSRSCGGVKLLAFNTPSLED